MIIKRLVTPEQNVRRYTLPPMELTPDEEGARMSSQAEVQQVAIARAKEFADRRGFAGGGYELVDYTKALSEMSPEDKAVERGVSTEDGDSLAEPTQRQRASTHFAERLCHYEQRGHTKAIAVTLAKDEERASGLHQVRAGLPANSPWAVAGQQEQQDDIRRFSKLTGQHPGEIVAKAYAGPDPLSITHEENRRRSRTELVQREAVSCLRRNIAQPDGQERARIDEWFADNFRTPRPTSGGGSAADVAAHNALREQTIEGIMEDVRRILRDPAARAALGAVVG